MREVCMCEVCMCKVCRGLKQEPHSTAGPLAVSSGRVHVLYKVLSCVCVTGNLSCLLPSLVRCEMDFPLYS